MNDPIPMANGNPNKDGDVPMKNTATSGFGRSAMTRLVFGAGLACLATAPVHAQWYFEVGPVYRGDMEISVQGGSRAAERDARGTETETDGARPTLPDPFLNDDGTAQILREFDNGFVGPSGWEWARNDGGSQFWGYDNPDQYDADADTLTFQLTTSASDSRRRTRTSTWPGSTGWTGSSRTDGFGILGTLGYLFRDEDEWSLGAQFRLGWLDGIESHFRNRPAYRQNIERSVYEASIWQDASYTYTYDTLGNPAFPAAPYAMTDPAGVGPMVGDTPESITRSSSSGGSNERLVGQSLSTAVSMVDLKVEAQAFTLQLGPRILWKPKGRVAFLVQPALSANLLDADLHRQETLRQPDGTVTESWSEHSDKQAWRVGAGVEVGAQVALSDPWHVTASGGYEWVDKYSLKAGPDHIRLDLSGYQLELAIGRSF